MSSKLRTASWVLLTIVGALVLLVSFISANLGYRGDYPIGGVPVAEVAAGREAILTALRGIRGTSAAYAAGFAVLFLATVLGPYRRGESGAWWAILAGMLAIVVITLARTPTLGIPMGQGGTGPALVLGGVILFGLLLDVGRAPARAEREALATRRRGGSARRSCRASTAATARRGDKGAPARCAREAARWPAN